MSAWLTSIAAAIWDGPRKILETYEWYMDRMYRSKHDRRVQEVLQHNVTLSSPVNGTHQKHPISASVEDIARDAKMSPKFALSSLKRLETKKLAVQDRNGWRTSL